MCFVTCISKLGNPPIKTKQKRHTSRSGDVWILRDVAFQHALSTIQHSLEDQGSYTQLRETKSQRLRTSQNGGFSVQFWDPNKHRLPGTFCESPCFFSRVPFHVAKVYLKTYQVKKMGRTALLQTVAYPNMSQFKVLVFDGGPPSRSL